MSDVFYQISRYKTILELLEKQKLDVEEDIKRTEKRIKDLQGCIDLLD